MKKILTILLTAAVLLAGGMGLAKKGAQTFPGKGQGGVHSNAPSTGTQLKGRERALEAGKGKKKGLYREEAARRHKAKDMERGHKAKRHRE